MRLEAGIRALQLEFKARGLIFGLKARFEDQGGGQRRRRSGEAGEAGFWGLRLIFKP